VGIAAMNALRVFIVGPILCGFLGSLGCEFVSND
jgi:hypothetical protein